MKASLQLKLGFIFFPVDDKFTTTKKSRETLEDVESWIDRSHGLEGMPLQYVIREDPNVPNAANDKGYSQPSVRDELLRRLSHAAPAYSEDNHKVWNMLYHVTHGTEAWAFVKGYQRTNNGRAAYVALKAHYTGASHINTIKLEADSLIEGTFWNGKARKFKWDGFISRLSSAVLAREEAAE